MPRKSKRRALLRNSRRSKRSSKKTREYGFVREMFTTMFAPSETLSFETRSEQIATRTLKNLPLIKGIVDHRPGVRILGVDVDKGKIKSTRALMKPFDCTFDANTRIHVENFIQFVEEKAVKEHRKEHPYRVDMNHQAARTRVLDVAVRALAMMWIEPKRPLLEVQLKERVSEKTMIQVRELLDVTFDHDDITQKMWTAWRKHFCVGLPPK